MKGYFITLEGTEGAGKTTQVPTITAFFKQMGYDTIVTREPGGSELAARIRSILLDPGNTELVPLAELFLYLADRAQHVQQMILPALEEGKIVICDRYADATVAYQGHARSLGPEMVSDLNNYATQGLKPDLTFLFDLPVEVGLGRAMSRIESLSSDEPPESRFELEALEFHRKVRSGYLSQAESDPDRFAVLNAEKPSKQLSADIKAELEKRSAQWKAGE